MIYNNEEYLDIPGFDAKYKASKSGKIIKIVSTEYGETIVQVGCGKTIGFNHNNKIKTERICKVIYSLFRGDIPEDHYVIHIDGNKLNNNLNNLRLTSRLAAASMNKKRQYRHCRNSEYVVYKAYSENVNYSVAIKNNHRQDIFNERESRCGICKKQFKIKDLCLDHNHKTGNIRGVLCRNCNAGIGFLQDNIAILKSATKYLLETDVYNKGIIYNKNDDIKSDEIMGTVASGLISFETASEVLRISRKEVKEEYKKFIEETKLFCNLMLDLERTNELMYSKYKTTEINENNFNKKEDYILYQWQVGSISKDEASSLLGISSDTTLYNRLKKLIDSMGVKL